MTATTLLLGRCWCHPTRRTLLVIKLKKRIAQSAIVGLVCLVSTLVAAVALQKTPAEGVMESKLPVASTSQESSVNRNALDRWAKVDDFKKGLPALLSDSQANPQNFVITDLARQLSSIRVGGFPVCADEEISSDQYIQLSEIAKKLDRYSIATSQMNKLLDTPAGITDCQFRILDGATASTASKLLSQ